MKRPSYKCKKYYPGGPIIGYVLNPQGSQWHGMWYWHMNNWFNPEEFPEYWELIIEKDYEILAFRLKNPNYPDLIRWKNSFGLFPSGEKEETNNRLNEFSEESLLKPENRYEIYSVKRKSDGVIFTIGDKIILDNWMQGREYVQVDEIYYNEHNQLSFRTNMSPAPKTFVFGLSDINYKIYKEPIFVTEDGVCVSNPKTQIWIVNNRLDSWATTADDVICRLVKTFSSYAAAKAYIEENKPQYSKKDVENIAHVAFRLQNVFDIDKLISNITKNR